MENSQYHYTIGGKAYHQEKLVLGQVEHLAKVLDGLTFDLDHLDVATILKTIGTGLPDALACVLIGEEESRRDILRDLDGPRERVQLFREEAEWDLGLRVVADFFGCNPMGIVPEFLAGMNSQLSRVTLMRPGKSTNASMPSSPEGTIEPGAPFGKA